MVVSPIDNLLHFLYALVRARARGRGNNIPREEEYVDHHSKSHAGDAAASHKTAAAAEITMTRRFFDFDSQIEQNERKSNGFPFTQKGQNLPTVHTHRRIDKQSVDQQLKL